MIRTSFAMAASLATLAAGLAQPASAQTVAKQASKAPSTTERTSALRDRIVGSWRLLSIYEESNAGEELTSFGVDPQGQFIATPTGHFSFQIVSRAGRRFAATSPSIAHGTGALREALSYFGSYTLDAAQGRLTFDIAYCLYRSCDQTRRGTSVRFIGDKMEFTAAVDGTLTGSGYNFLIWERE